MPLLDEARVVRVSDVPASPVGNGYKTWVRVLFPISDMPTFAMRVFEMDEDGYIEEHSHPWEHEIFVLQGRLRVTVEGGVYDLEPGMAIYIPPNRVHGYRNLFRGKTLFICVIPVKPSV